jgi:hypothetical protein
MKTTANALRLSFDESSKPELILSLNLSRQEAMIGVQELREILGKGKLLEVEVKQHRVKRSLDSNGYLWTLCQKLSEKLRCTKEDVYREAIRKVGQFEYLAVSEDATEQFIRVWNGRGLGWYAEDMDCKIHGCRKVMAYYGSSCYDTRQMSVLVDYIVEECKEQGIETLPPEQIEAMNKEWGK